MFSIMISHIYQHEYNLRMMTRNHTWMTYIILQWRHVTIIFWMTLCSIILQWRYVTIFERRYIILQWRHVDIFEWRYIIIQWRRVKMQMMNNSNFCHTVFKCRMLQIRLHTCMIGLTTMNLIKQKREDIYLSEFELFPFSTKVLEFSERSGVFQEN